MSGFVATCKIQHGSENEFGCESIVYSCRCADEGICESGGGVCAVALLPLSSGASRRVRLCPASGQWMVFVLHFNGDMILQSTDELCVSMCANVRVEAKCSKDN